MSTIGTSAGGVSTFTIYENRAEAFKIGTLASTGTITQIAADLVRDTGSSGSMAWAIYTGSGGIPTTRIGQGTFTVAAGAHSVNNISCSVSGTSGDEIWVALQSVDSSNRNLLYLTGTAGSGSTNYTDYTPTFPAFNNPFVNGDHATLNVPAIEVTYGSGAATATITPTTAALSIAGKTPSTSLFTNVRIREVLITASGQVVANAANIRLMVWYSGQAIGAPDVSVNGQTTDANGTTSWSIATGTLIYNTPIFYVAQDSVSYVNYTCARMTPSYE